MKMTNEERVFERELELFRKECEGAAQFFFGHLAINEMAKRRESVLLALFGVAAAVATFVYARFGRQRCQSCGRAYK